MGSPERDEVGVHDRVMRLTQRLIAEADEVGDAFVARHRIHPTDMRSLIRVVVGRNGREPTTVGWLGKELGLSAGTVTAVIDRLERSGNLQRVRDPRDRRRVLLEPTSDGQGVVEGYFAPIRQHSEEVMTQFSSSELDVVSRYLGALAAVMTAHRAFPHRQATP